MPPRMTANPIRPARHRAGKDTGNSSSSGSDSSDNENESKPAVPPPKASSAKPITSSLTNVDLDARRRLAEAAEAQRKALLAAERRAAEEGFVTEEESNESESEAESDDDDDDEEDSSSEEEAPRRLMMRPKFIPKTQRSNKPDHSPDDDQLAEARRAAADALVEEQIKKDLAAREMKKHWDDAADDSDVDTTDDVDVAAEEAAWRVRELKRLRRARAAVEERERELAEVERRRNLTEEERRAEDDAFLAGQAGERESKGRMGYMQRYFHRGAFFRDETAAAGLLQRDVMGGRIQDDVRDRESLPEYLQKRDMAKLGRKGASKYKDMRSEDTGQWGGHRGDERRGRRYEGEDDRFRPDEDRGGGGANAVPLGRKRSTSRERLDKRRRVV